MWFTLQLASVTFWAGSNVIDSVMVHRYEKHPVVLMWYQCVFSVPVLGIAAMIQDVHSTWMVPLLLVGVIAYVGDLTFFRALDLIDVSVTGIAWVILSVFLSICGVLFLEEAWSTTEMLGVLGVLIGVILLSLWHRRVSSVRSFLLLPFLALLATPFYLVQKEALLMGESVFPVFFWSIVGREVCSFLFPWFVPSFRSRILSCAARRNAAFHMLNGTVIALFFGGTFFTTWAFATGPLSLVSIVGNVQPFIVLFFAWLACRLIPAYAPRELLTAQSVQVKLLCFLIVFAGLALLALG